jgi:formate dehydrogenase subunit gamma
MKLFPALFFAAALLGGPAFAQSPGSLPQSQPRQDEIQAQQQRAATQPGNNAPVWRNVQSGAPNYTSVKGRETDVLIQAPARFPGQNRVTTAGEAWREFRNGPVTFIGGWGLVAVIALILGLYLWKGPVKLHERPTGRLLRRFSAFEMTVHWSAAISFCILALSGLVMLFGKHVLLPLIGYTLFSWLAILSKNLHNFVGPLFVVCVVLLFFTFVRDNLWRKHDFAWIRKFGGLFSDKDVPSGKFNGGEKLWFWGGLLVCGVIVSGSGLILDFPNFGQTRSAMQTANIVHLAVASLFMVVGLGHIYMGTIGMAGAYDAMRTGYVDEAWAKEHHEYWYNDIKAGKVPAALEGVPDGSADLTQRPA